MDELTLRAALEGLDPLELWQKIEHTTHELRPPEEQAVFQNAAKSCPTIMFLATMWIKMNEEHPADPDIVDREGIWMAGHVTGIIETLRFLVSALETHELEQD